MRKLLGIGACVEFALSQSACSEQAKPTKDAAPNVAGQAKGDVENAGKALKEVGAGANKALKEAGASANKAVQEVGAGAGQIKEAAGQALAETRTKIAAAAAKASEALGEQFSKASEQASKTMESVKGGPELIQKVRDIMPSLQKTLAGISDKESADKALPKLEELDGTVGKLSGQFNALPESAKKTVGELIQKGTGSLQPLVEGVLALPAVQTIRPKLESIMNQLKGLKG